MNRATQIEQWCGPTALSTITGKPYNESVKMIEQISGKKFRATSSWGDLCASLLIWGVKMKGGRLRNRRSLLSVAKEHYDDVIMVRVGKHFMVILGEEYYDQHYLWGRPVHQVRKFVTHIAVIE